VAIAGRVGREARACAQAMTTLVTGAAGFLGSHVTRQLVARGGNGARAGEGVEQQPSDQRFAAGVRDWRFTGRGFAGPGDGRSSAGVSRCGGLPVVGQENEGYLRFERWRDQESAGGGEAGGRGAADLHQHGGDDCSGPAGTAERIYQRETGRDGGALQAFEVDGGARGVAGCERRLAGDCGDADYAGGGLGIGSRRRRERLFWIF